MSMLFFDLLMLIFKYLRNIYSDYNKASLNEKKDILIVRVIPLPLREQQVDANPKGQ